MRRFLFSRFAFSLVSNCLPPSAPTTRRLLHEHHEENFEGSSASYLNAESEATTEEEVSEHHHHHFPVRISSTPKLTPTAAESVIAVFTDAVPSPNADQLVELLADCRSAQELKRAVNDLAFRHPLIYDPFNGHGFRTLLHQKVLEVALKVGDFDTWYQFAQDIRALGYELSRTNVGSSLDLLKKAVVFRFEQEGRNPQIVGWALNRARALWNMCIEDGIQMDFVFFIRAIILAHNIVACFDRQHLFRETWYTKAEAHQRVGLVPEWTVPPMPRVPDFDSAIVQCNEFVSEIVASAKELIPTRPPFSFFMRLGDYYFAVDDFERLLAVLEDARGSGVVFADATTAKLIQLSANFNIPATHELFLEWRVAPSHCVITCHDISRLLFFYARAGGGLPCPNCGEPFNHRNQSLRVWQRSTPAQKNCSFFALAQTKRGEYENIPSLPQNRDWSEVAFQLRKLSEARAIHWSFNEWKAFLLCCLHAPKEKALEAAKLVEASYSRKDWDSFLGSTFIRLHRIHCPQEVISILKRWVASEANIGKGEVQESCLTLAHLTDSDAIVQLGEYLRVRMIEDRDYTFPYTRRRLLSFLEASGRSLDVRARTVVQALADMKPESPGQTRGRDSHSDIPMGRNKKCEIYR